MLRLSNSLLRSTQPLAAVRALSATADKPFDKILVANRGEIACRVMKTAKRMGVKTVAIYSEADANAMHVRMADEAVCVGPAASSESYLNIPRILEAIEETGAQAVHPGYGFLSENADFVTALDNAGVTFIGPPEKAIEDMGDKIASKDIAIAAGVNTIPGFQGVLKDEDDAVRVANEVGYPVMVKASAGGGGKGMRIAYNDDEAREAFRLSTEEALSSFGDDRLFVERFIEDPRHIEIQLLADSHGNVVPFPERECSIQRRNQKVLEEAPSVLLDAETRKAMGEQAAMLARAVGYRSAGTVEMLVDANKNFYFLEMNTRLQVEHPVTEYISGVDLVEHMLWIAAGRALPDELLAGVPINGWAMEARVYAEEPLRGFLPATGRLLRYHEPQSTREANGQPTVRVDTGVEAGAEISMFYDPMISKLVTYGETREAALEAMNAALDSYVIHGCGNNLSFLRELCRHPDYASGNMTTKFIEEHYPDGFHGVELAAGEKAQFAAYAALIEAAKQQEGGEYVVTLGGFSGEPFAVRIGDGDVAQVRPYGAEHEGAEWTDVAIEGGAYQPQDLLYQFAPGPEYVQLLAHNDDGFKLMFRGCVQDVIVRSARAQELAAHMLPKPEVDTSKFLLCPMPGMVISISVQPGDEVIVGQELAVVEAMKMQNVLRAEKAGVVQSVNCAAGDSLAVDAVMVEFEE